MRKYKAMENERSRNKFDIEVNGRVVFVDDATVSGREIIDAAHQGAASDYGLIQIKDRELQSIGLQQKIDLREYNRARFLTFEGGETFQFTVDERGYEWGAESISAIDIRLYAQISDDLELVLDKAQDEAIPDDGSVSLATRGVEHVITRKRPPKPITIRVNTRPKVVHGTRISWDELLRLAYDPVPSGPLIEFTVQFRKGPEPRVEGSMQAGTVVNIKDGMIFNVSFTDKS